MKPFIKLSILSLALFLQSCNMSKHYANMRIDHDDEQISNEQKEKPASTPHTKTTQLHSDPIPLELTKKSELDSVIVANNEVQKNITKKMVHVKQPETLSKKTYYVTLEGKKNAFKVNRIKRKIQKLNISVARSTSGAEELLGVVCWILIVAAIVLIVIFTWEILAAFWIALGMIMLVIAGVLVGMGIVIWAILETIWGGL